MNKELKRVSFVVLAMFVALLASSTYITAFQADSLRSDGRNSRALLASYSAQRGPILVGGTAVAESTPVDDQYMFQRSYAQPQLYAPVTGYYTLGQGARGLEDALNDELTGNANSQFFDQVNTLLTGQDPVGATVNTTIDPVVQQAAWDSLGANAGAVVAIEPSTGKVLAMVSKPSYDPNLLASHDREAVTAAYDQLISDPSDPLQNKTIQGDLYVPGSTFKLVTTAAALESGDYTPDSTFPNPATLTLPGTSTNINNAEGGSCGGGETTTLATALRLSCNIPMAELGQALGAEALADQAEAFGFGRSVDVPQRSTPSRFPIEDADGDPIDDATLMLQSFGQGSDRVTPLQMAMVSSAIANDGTEMTPTLVESILNPDLSPVREFSPDVFSRPVSGDTASTMTDMMVQNVADGAASGARINGVEVAGKTGTAENGAGEPYTLWFTGFAPADDPQVAVAVVVENGGGRGQSAFGNQVAAPIAKNVLEAVLNK